MFLFQGPYVHVAPPSAEFPSIKSTTVSNIINSPLDKIVAYPSSHEAAVSSAGYDAKKSSTLSIDEHLKLIESMGGPTSTMDPAYDAKRPDESWICVFCKRGTHVLVSLMFLFFVNIGAIIFIILLLLLLSL